MAKIVIFLGSVRTKREGIKPARFVKNKLEERNHEVFLADPLEYKLPLLDKTYKEYAVGKAPKVMEELSKKISEADGFVMVTAEYNHGPPAALKNMLDHFAREYFFKPSAVVSYSTGSFGGIRAAIQLRAILAELGMPTIPTMFPIPMVHEAFEEDGTPKDRKYYDRIKKFVAEFEWYLEAFANQRKKGTPY